MTAVAENHSVIARSSAVASSSRARTAGWRTALSYRLGKTA
jgi:hypothetical protein